jgi:hypothetical protein
MPIEVRSDERVTNYTQFWQKDSAKDNEDHRAIRFDKYTDLVNGEYICSELPLQSLHLSDRLL